MAVTSSVEIAYIISAYKYPEQLTRLVSRLNTGGVHFFIHVDKKTENGIYLQAANALSQFPNVYFLKRHRCYWGGFGHVRASLKGIAAVAARKLPVDYLILLTGQDYPIVDKRADNGFPGAKSRKVVP